MVVIVPPPVPGLRPAWMRNTLLVAALAGAGEDGAESNVPGSTLLVPAPDLRPRLA
ncbi:MAG TPA: hypothetical protein VGR28_04510 [Candidatus Thermoplasmatota archaeon]|jgi:hypothetical protein|nr:hypothetical protein [Candidatus Thermoplasmatota archaeon]